MGSELICDWWLEEFLLPGSKGVEPASRLAHMQISTYSSTGHVVHLSDQYVRRKLRASLKVGRIERLWIRCMRCGTAAWIGDWLAASQYDVSRRKMAAETIERTLRNASVAFLQPCPGARYVDWLGEQWLSSLSGGAQ